MRRGQPASTQACNSATRHSVERPIRIGRGIQPAASHARHDRVVFPHIRAASQAGMSSTGGVNWVSMMASGTSDGTSILIPSNEHSRPELAAATDFSLWTEPDEQFTDPALRRQTHYPRCIVGPPRAEIRPARTPALRRRHPTTPPNTQTPNSPGIGPGDSRWNRRRCRGGSNRANKSSKHLPIEDCPHAVLGRG